MPQEPFDRLIKAALNASQEAPRDVHPDVETLAAWFDRSLDADVMHTVETHLSACPRCQAYAATLVHIDTAASSEGASSAAESVWRRWGLRWLAPAGAVAVLALWIVWPRGAVAPAPAPTPEGVEARLEEPAPPAADLRANRAAAGPTEPSQTNADRPAARGAAAAATAAGATAAAPAPSAATPAAPAAEMAPTEAGRIAANEVLSQAATTGALAAAKSAEAPVAVGARREADALAPAQAAAPVAVRWRIVGGRTVERTTPDGTWMSVELPSPGSLTALSSPGGEVCWVVGRDGLVLVSTDGTRFEARAFAPRADLVAVRATDVNTAVVTRADGRRFRTTDRGATWESAEP
jgi:hypothetical protein